MGFNYQAVVRNNLGFPIINKQVKLKISVIRSNVSGVIVYEEDHDTKTNQFGLVNLIVGKGTKTGGTLNFNNIPWGADNFFVKVGLNLDNKWINLGTAQLQSVPYALTSGSAQGLGKYAISGTDPTDSQVLRYNATLKVWEPAAMSGSGSVTNVSATAPLSISGNATISPVISMPVAGALQSGYLAAADWNTFNQKQNSLIAGSNIVINGNTISGITNAVTNASANGVTISGNTLIISTASGSSYGLLSPQDWNTFNSKLGAEPTILGLGNITVTGSYPLYSIEGSGSSVTTSASANGVTISGNTLIISTASGTSYGLLSPQDWNTFNNKLGVEPTILGLGNITVTGSYPLYSIEGSGSAVTTSANANGVTISGNTLIISTASGTSYGLLSPQDWNTFNSKLGAEPTILGLGNITVTGSYPLYSIEGSGSSITTSANANGVTISGNTLIISTASGTSYGLLSPQDWNTFNSKQDLLIAGPNITINGNTISGTGAGLPIISLTPGVSIIGNLLSINNASGITNGLLTSTDWNVFNNKQNTIVAGSGISISGGNTVINTKPDQIVSLTGIGVVSVTGTYPNFSINAPLFNLNSGSGISISGGNTIVNTKPDQIVSLTGIGVVTVTGTYPNFSINAPSFNLNSGSGISISGGNTIVNTKPDQIVSLTGMGVVSIAGAYPNFSINAPSFNLNSGSGISISGGNTIVNTKPDQIVSLTGMGVVSIAGTYPNFTINAPQVSITAGANISVTGAFPNFTVSSSGSGVAGSFDNGRVSTILGVITNFGNDLINSNLTLNDTDGDVLIYQFNLPLVKKIRPSTIIEVELNAPTFLDDIKAGAIASFTIKIAAQNPTWGGTGFISDNGKQNYTPLFMKAYYDNIGAGVSLNVSIYLKVIGGAGQIKIKDVTNILNDNNIGGYLLIRETY